jgi:sarcosine oxidase subunit gamma
MRVSAPEPRSALASHLVPGSHGRAGAVGVTLMELNTGLVEIAARRGQETALDAEVQRHLGVGLPAPGRAFEAGNAAALWIAPTTAMILAPTPRLAPLLGAIAPAVAAVLDQSGGFAVLRVAGPMASATLAKGCRLDLDARVFAGGRVARSLIAQVPAILYRPGGDAGFDVIVPATFARSFAEFLGNAAAEFGCTILPAGPRPVIA